eukprot:4026270-Heterocapsa_arctica.AAC.1
MRPPRRCLVPTLRCPRVPPPGRVPAPLQAAQDPPQTASARAPVRSFGLATETLFRRPPEHLAPCRPSHRHNLHQAQSSLGRGVLQGKPLPPCSPRHDHPRLPREVLVPSANIASTRTRSSEWPAPQSVSPASSWPTVGFRPPVFCP